MNAVLGDVCKENFLRNASEDFLSLDPLGVGSDEMLVGRAGYLAGCLWLHQRIGCQVSKGEVAKKKAKNYGLFFQTRGGVQR